MYFAASALPSSFLWRTLQHPAWHHLLKTRACRSPLLAQVSNIPASINTERIRSTEKCKINSPDLISLCLYPRHPEEPPVKAMPPSPPASSSVTTVPSGDLPPSATSSPREEPNGLEDSVNGAPAKRPHLPAEEELAKRHKDAEVRMVFSGQGRS